MMMRGLVSAAILALLCASSRIAFCSIVGVILDQKESYSGISVQCSTRRSAVLCIHVPSNPSDFIGHVSVIKNGHTHFLFVRESMLLVLNINPNLLLFKIHHPRWILANGKGETKYIYYVLDNNGLRELDGNVFLNTWFGYSSVPFRWMLWETREYTCLFRVNDYTWFVEPKPGFFMKSIADTRQVYWSFSADEGRYVERIIFQRVSDDRFMTVVVRDLNDVEHHIDYVMCQYRYLLIPSWDMQFSTVNAELGKHVPIYSDYYKAKLKLSVNLDLYNPGMKFCRMECGSVPNSTYKLVVAHRNFQLHEVFLRGKNLLEIGRPGIFLLIHFNGDNREATYSFSYHKSKYVVVKASNGPSSFLSPQLMAMILPIFTFKLNTANLVDERMYVLTTHEQNGTQYIAYTARPYLGFSGVSHTDSRGWNYTAVAVDFPVQQIIIEPFAVHYVFCVEKQYTRVYQLSGSPNFIRAGAGEWQYMQL